MTTPLRILEISASTRQQDSISRQLTDDLVAALETRHQAVHVTRRDLAAGLPAIDATFARAIYMSPDARNAEEQQALALSDELIAELQAADVLVIGTAMYNFSIPSPLKAWVDQVARAQVTFRYTENGPEGLLQGKKAYVVVSSGGVPVGSPVDFATPYLRHVLGFIGITDVEFIGAAGADRGNDQALDDARVRIADLVHLEAQVA